MKIRLMILVAIVLCGMANANEKDVEEKLDSLREEILNVVDYLWSKAQEECTLPNLKVLTEARLARCYREVEEFYLSAMRRDRRATPALQKGLSPSGKDVQQLDFDEEFDFAANGLQQLRQVNLHTPAQFGDWHCYRVRAYTSCHLRKE